LEQTRRVLIKEIRLHGRGGQGIVLAAEIIVHAAMIDGLYGSALPSFGVERRGSPVASFVRLDDRPIREKSQIYSPNCIVVSDSTLLGAVDVFAGIQEGTTVVLNTTKAAETSNLPFQIIRLGILDATRIALEVLGIPVTNTAILGAFAKATGWVQVSSILEGIRRVMPPELVERNVEAARRAAQEVRLYEMKKGH
jgi:2-oxoacid:acceptor oxidoreductase gamma subunit (pyruvate/2-ketoisovalerate family)